MELLTFTTVDDAAAKAFDIIKEGIEKGSIRTLGLATGGTPLKFYEKFRQSKLDVSNISTVNLDEYVGLKATDEHSYHSYMNTELFSSYFRKLSFSDLGSLFYIGPLHSENSFNELVGYNTSESAYLKITFWCISAIGIVFILLLKSARTVRDKTFILIICLFLLIGNTIIFPNIFQDEKPIFSYENSAKEIKYYKVPKEDVAQNYLQYS